VIINSQPGKRPRHERAGRHRVDAYLLNIPPLAPVRGAFYNVNFVFILMVEIDLWNNLQVTLNKYNSPKMGGKPDFYQSLLLLYNSPGDWAQK
jgi:hypothetical protein